MARKNVWRKLLFIYCVTFQLVHRRFQRDVFSLAGIGPKYVIRNSDVIRPEQVKSTVSIIGDLQSGSQKNFSSYIYSRIMTFH